MATTAKAIATNRRRLMQEARELSGEDTLRDGLVAAPLEDDLFEWHWTVKGPSGSDFDGGLYHGRLVLPPEYPFKPPELYLLTPSGRFETNTKVCLSISSFHPETWQPSWGIRTALIALTAFFGSDPKGAVGSLDAPPAERRRLAQASKAFKCAKCGYAAHDSPLVAAAPAPLSVKVDGDGVVTRGGTQSDDTATQATVVHSDEASATEEATESKENETETSAEHGSKRAEAAVLSPSSPSSPWQETHHRISERAQQQQPLEQGPRRGHQQRHEGGVDRQQQQQQVVVVPLGHEQGAHGRTPASALRGGDPLWTDRAILVVLLALVACVVRKIA